MTTYTTDVKDVVDDFKRAIEDKDITDPYSAQTWIHQTIDGSSRVIWTHQAKECMCESPNSDAFEDYGIEEVVKDGSLNWSLMAYCAFEADIRDALLREGIELHDESTYIPEEQ